MSSTLGWMLSVVLLAAECWGNLTFEVETSSLRIREPEDLAGMYNASIGDMGIPLYGASLVGRLFYISQDSEMCKDFKAEYSAEWIRSDLPIILLVQRGKCYFLEKALRAQKAGADAVIIYDNMSGKLLTMVAPSQALSTEYYNLTIPTVFITKELGDKLVKAVDVKKQDVVVELDWRESILHPDDRVEWEFWYSSLNGCTNQSHSCVTSQEFLQKFEKLAVDFEKKGDTKFTPHVMFRECRDSWHNLTYCKDCIKNRRYCSIDFIHSKYRTNYTIGDVSWMNLRHLCAFHIADIQQQPWRWWQFAVEFSRQCGMDDGNFTQECAERAIENAGIDVGDVQTCMGERDADEDFAIIKAEIDARYDNDGTGRGMVTMLPTVVINAEQYKGRLDPVGVQRAICAGFKEGTEPIMCLSSNIQTDDCTYDQKMCWQQDGVSACVDTFRGHVCKCPKGWQGDGVTTCKDVDECKTQWHGCEHKCINLLGTYKCECKEGYALYGGDGVPGICIPKNLCLFNNGGCEDVCIVTSPGKSRCSCADGLELNEDDQHCSDIDECVLGTHQCEQKCHNVDPRNTEGAKYTCSCDEQGYMQDPNNATACILRKTYLQRTGIEEEVQKARKIDVGAIIGIVVAVLTVVALAGALVYRFVVREYLRRQVVDLMSLYMPLDDEKVSDESCEKSDGNIVVQEVERSTNEV